MLSMIELHVERLFEVVGKSFQRRIIATHVGVTDRAHWHAGVGELRQVTGSAILVTGETGSG
jgi:Tfp pilus assembly pilus retraction ATPase PilT